MKGDESMAEKKSVKVIETTVEQRTWDVDDYYSVIPEISVDSTLDGLRTGDKVRVTIEKI